MIAKQKCGSASLRDSIQSVDEAAAAIAAMDEIRDAAAAKTSHVRQQAMPTGQTQCQQDAQKRRHAFATLEAQPDQDSNGR